MEDEPKPNLEDLAEFVPLPSWLQNAADIVANGCCKILIKHDGLPHIFFAVMPNGSITDPMTVDDDDASAWVKAMKETVKIVPTKAIIQACEAFMVLRRRSEATDNPTDAFVQELRQDPTRKRVLHINIEVKNEGYYAAFVGLIENAEGKVTGIEEVKYHFRPYHCVDGFACNIYDPPEQPPEKPKDEGDDDGDGTITITE